MAKESAEKKFGTEVEALKAKINETQKNLHSIVEKAYREHRSVFGLSDVSSGSSVDEALKEIKKMMSLDKFDEAEFNPRESRIILDNIIKEFEGKMREVLSHTFLQMEGKETFYLSSLRKERDVLYDSINKALNKKENQIKSAANANNKRKIALINEEFSQFKAKQQGKIAVINYKLKKVKESPVFSFEKSGFSFVRATKYMAKLCLKVITKLNYILPIILVGVYPMSVVVPAVLLSNKILSSINSKIKVSNNNLDEMNKIAADLSKAVDAGFEKISVLKNIRYQYDYGILQKKIDTKGVKTNLEALLALSENAAEFAEKVCKLTYGTEGNFEWRLKGLEQEKVNKINQSREGIKSKIEALAKNIHESKSSTDVNAKKNLNAQLSSLAKEICEFNNEFTRLTKKQEPKRSASSMMSAIKGVFSSESKPISTDKNPLPSIKKIEGHNNYMS